MRSDTKANQIRNCLVCKTCGLDQCDCMKEMLTTPFECEDAPVSSSKESLPVRVSKTRWL